MPIVRCASTDLLALSVAEFSAKDLARGGLGNRVDELDQPDLLVRGDFTGDELLALLGGGLGTWLQGDEGLGELAALLVGDPNHGGVADGGVCLLYTSPSPRDRQKSRMPSSA